MEVRGVVGAAGAFENVLGWGVWRARRFSPRSVLRCFKRLVAKRRPWWVLQPTIALEARPVLVLSSTYNISVSGTDHDPSNLNSSFS